MTRAAAQRHVARARKVLAREAGQDLIEYVGLIAVVAILIGGVLSVVPSLGHTISHGLSCVVQEVLNPKVGCKSSTRSASPSGPLSLAQVKAQAKSLSLSKDQEVVDHPAELDALVGGHASTQDYVAYQHEYAAKVALLKRVGGEVLRTFAEVEASESALAQGASQEERSDESIAKTAATSACDVGDVAQNPPFYACSPAQWRQNVNTAMGALGVEQNPATVKFIEPAKPSGLLEDLAAESLDPVNWFAGGVAGKAVDVGKSVLSDVGSAIFGGGAKTAAQSAGDSILGRAIASNRASQIARTAGSAASVAKTSASRLTGPVFNTIGKLADETGSINPSKLLGRRAARTGGIAPVLKGQAGEARAITELTAQGDTIEGQQVTIKTPVGRTRVDIVAKNNTGVNRPGFGSVLFERMNHAPS
ncbi:MAG: hypothetical protein J2O48_11635, partial [Solirubrobacterales bacterium]|nr:hypothetical protein [Solirubrobacterales bacterium]